MKIALVSPFEALGGAESYSLNLAKALSQLNNSVTLYTNSDKTWERSSSKNLKTRYVQSRVLPVDPGNPASITLIKELLKENYDIIHAHQMYSFFNLSSSFSGWIKRIPTILTDHGGGWRLAAFPHVSANFPKGFAAVSDFSLSQMLRFAPSKREFSRVVYGGVNTNVFQPNRKNDQLSERLDLGDNRTILCLGRVLPHKGVDVVIRAFRLLPPDTKLLVVGQILDGEYLRYLKALTSKYCKGRVNFIGPINDDKLPEYYNLCDVFVQSSLYFDYRGNYHRFPELLGLAKLEAMACAKPVVVSRVGGLPEKIIHGINGYIFEPGNEEQLAYFINMLLPDQALRKKVGANGLITIQSDLTWDKVAKHNLEFYKFLLKN